MGYHKISNLKLVEDRNKCNNMSLIIRYFVYNFAYFPAQNSLKKIKMW